MIFGSCPACDHGFGWGWDGKQRGHMVALCHKCREPMWIEFSRLGSTRDHEAFIKEIATPGGRVDEANEAMRSRVESGLSIEEEDYDEPVAPRDERKVQRNAAKRERRARRKLRKRGGRGG